LQKNHPKDKGVILFSPGFVFLDILPDYLFIVIQDFIASAQDHTFEIERFLHEPGARS